MGQENQEYLYKCPESNAQLSTTFFFLNPALISALEVSDLSLDLNLHGNGSMVLKC